MKMNDYHNFTRIFQRPESRKILFTVFLLFLCAANSFAQQRTFTVKGTIKDNVMSVPGASVLIEGTSTGTITDADGNYELKITSDQPTALCSAPLAMPSRCRRFLLEPRKQ
jgi:hypothetical protein